MTSADVRTRLANALRLDLVGPEPEDPQITEILNVPPSRWDLTGFLVPAAAPVKQKQDQDDAQGELGLTEPATAADEDDNKEEAPAARRGQFPSSIGISVLVPKDATELRVNARWGDYTPREVGTRPDIEWTATNVRNRSSCAWWATRLRNPRSRSPAAAASRSSPRCARSGVPRN